MKLVAFVLTVTSWPQRKTGIHTRYHALMHVLTRLAMKLYFRHWSIKQILPNEDSREDPDKKAFKSRGGIFCLTPVPFGLKNAPETATGSKRPTHKCQMANFHCIIDDIIIIYRTPYDHIGDSWHVFTFLSTLEWYWTWRVSKFYGWSLLPPSCHSPGGHLRFKTTIDAICWLQHLGNLVQFRSFFGVCNMFCHFEWNSARIVA